MNVQEIERPKGSGWCVRCQKTVDPRLLTEEERAAQDDKECTHVCPNCLLPGIYNMGLLRPRFFHVATYFI